MTITVQGGQTYALSGLLEDIVRVEPGAYDYGVGGVLSVSGAATIGHFGVVVLEASSTFYRFGTSGGTLAVSGTLTNNGAIYMDGGATGSFYQGSVHGSVLNNTGVLNNAGYILVGAAQSISAIGFYNTDTGAVLNDAGRLNNIGLLKVGASAPGYTETAPGGTILVGGVLTNSGTLLVDASYGAGQSDPHADSATARAGQLQISQTGSLTNSGQLTLATGDGYHSQSGVSAGGTLMDAGRLTNNGIITAGGGIGGQYNYYSATGAVITIVAGGTLTNNALLKLDGAGGGTPFALNSGTGATLTNSGVLTNGGTIVVGASDIEGSGAGQAVLADAGTLTNNGSLILRGAESYNGFDYGATLAVTGSLTNFGHINVDGGVQAESYYFSVGYGAAIVDSGVLTNSGTILVGGAFLGTNSGYPSSTGGRITVTGTLTNQKFIEVQGGQTPPPYGKTGPSTQGGQIADSRVLNNYGTIKLDAGLAAHDRSATLTVTGTLTNSGTINGGGTLLNMGTILSGTGLVADIASTGFLNNGQVKVTPGGALRVDSGVTATANDRGNFAISSGGTLTFNSSVGISQTASFVGTGPEVLVLGSVSNFAGTLAGLHPTDMIDFLHTAVSSVSASGTTLKLDLTGGGTIALKLAAPLPGSDLLQLASDGTGGTRLTIATPPHAVPAGGPDPVFRPGVSAGDLHGAVFASIA